MMILGEDEVTSQLIMTGDFGIKKIDTKSGEELQ